MLGKVANMTNRRFETQFRGYFAAEKRGRQTKEKPSGDERRDLGQEAD